MIHLNFHATVASEIHGWVLHDDRNREFRTCGAGFNWRNGFSKLLRKLIVQKPKKNTIIWFISNLKLKYQSNYKQENSLQVWIKNSTIQKKMRLKGKSFECSSEVLIVPFSKQGHMWRIFFDTQTHVSSQLLFDSFCHVSLKNVQIVVNKEFKKKTVSLLQFEP